TSSTAATVDLNLSSGTVGGSAGTLTFRNDAASGTGVFQPRFSAGFTFGRPIVINNGSFGTTLLQSFNTTGNDQTFNGVISVSGANDLTLSGAVSLGASTRTFQTDNSGVTELSGIVASTGGGLSKTGNGVLKLSNANTYTGGTTISAGTLALSGSGAINNSPN